MGQKRNHKGNQKIFINEQKQKYKNLKFQDAVNMTPRENLRR